VSLPPRASALFMLLSIGN